MALANGLSLSRGLREGRDGPRVSETKCPNLIHDFAPLGKLLPGGWTTFDACHDSELAEMLAVQLLVVSHVRLLTRPLSIRAWSRLPSRDTFISYRTLLNHQPPGTPSTASRDSVRNFVDFHRGA